MNLTAVLMYTMIVDWVVYPLRLLPSFVFNLRESQRAMKRIQQVLMLDEMQEGLRDTSRTAAIEVRGNFSWGFDSETVELNLKQIDLRIEKGEFVCVVGAVGAGKSSLLSAIIGEMLFVPEDHSKLTTT